MDDLFSSQAALYARYRPTYPRELYEFIFRHLHRQQYAWDCATGSGQVAAFLAGQIGFTRIAAVAEDMLRQGTLPPPPASLDEVLTVDREARIRTRALLQAA